VSSTLPGAATLHHPGSQDTGAHHIGLDADELRRALEETGSALLPQLLPASLCTELRDMYECDPMFRSRVVMARHHYGRGEYKYFAAPLPPLIMQLRRELYAQLAPIANQWHERLQRAERFPSELAEFTDRCHRAGQTRPTPLLLRYTRNDYNCLHQDLYGAHVFPLQVAILLSQPGRDFTGGEFVLTEQRPRLQSRVEVLPLQQGDAAVFAVNERPIQGARGDARVRLRHGVSRIRQGERFTLGLIFHDAA
jgi:hypothetical protein